MTRLAHRGLTVVALLGLALTIPSSASAQTTDDPYLADRTNRLLRQLEDAWLDNEGLQDRPGSRNLYVSPDPFSGYASWMLPGVRYEIETDDPVEVPAWEAKYIRAIDRLVDVLDRATAELEG